MSWRLVGKPLYFVNDRYEGLGVEILPPPLIGLVYHVARERMTRNIDGVEISRVVAIEM